MFPQVTLSLAIVFYMFIQPSFAKDCKTTLINYYHLGIQGQVYELKYKVYKVLLYIKIKLFK